MCMFAGCEGDSAHKVELNTLVWTPGPQGSFTQVFFGRLPRNSSCEDVAKSQKGPDGSEIQFFDSCGVASIFVPSKALLVDGKEQRALVASHEAFHLMVQIGKATSLKVRMDAVTYLSAAEQTRHTRSVDKMNAFYRAALDRATGRTTQCQQLRETYAALNDLEKGRAAWESSIEWPAEFYMAKVNHLDEARYVRFRKNELQYVEEDIKYLAGYYALGFVDAHQSRANWQAEYVAGVNPVDLFSKAIGCGPILQPSAVVSMKGSEL